MLSDDLARQCEAALRGEFGVALCGAFATWHLTGGGNPADVVHHADELTRALPAPFKFVALDGWSPLPRSFGCRVSLPAGQDERRLTFRARLRGAAIECHIEVEF